MKKNQRAPEVSSVITAVEKAYKAKEKILYDKMMEPIRDAHPAYMSITIEQLGSRGWGNSVLKEIVIKEMAQKGWGWRTGNYVNGITNTFEFVQIGEVSYKGPEIPSVLMTPVS